MTTIRRALGRRRAVAAPTRPSPGVRARVKAMRERFVFNRELRLRLISASILIPLVLVSTWFGEVSFLIVVLLTGALVLFEWLRMIGAGHLASLHIVGWTSLALIAVAAQLLPLLAAAIVVALGGAISGAVALRNRCDVAVRWVVAGTLYSGLAILALVALRKGHDGFGAVVFVFLIAWASDTVAFFVGRKVGGPKLWPRVSPSKTWSGAAGGFVAGVVFGAVVATWLEVPLTMGTLGLAAAVAVAAQLGDLIESAAKRHFMVKDAGSIIPGHGGVMDRVDGVVAAALVSAGLGATLVSETPASGLLMVMGR